MASITIRNLDDDTKTLLPTWESNHSYSMAEARIILREAVCRKSWSRNLADIACSYFGPDNGVNMEFPAHGPRRELPLYD